METNTEAAKVGPRLSSAFIALFIEKLGMEAQQRRP